METKETKSYEPASSLTAVEYAAIHLKVPCGTRWIDEMVVESLKNKFAASIAAGECASQNEFCGVLTDSKHGREQLFSRCFNFSKDFITDAELFSVEHSK